MNYLFIISFMMVLSSVLGLIALLIRSSERAKHLAREQMNMVIQQLSNTNPNTNPNTNSTPSQPYQDPYDMPSLDLTRNELYKALNFMLMMGIITSEQYNEIEAKAFPYIKS